MITVMKGMMLMRVMLRKQKTSFISIEKVSMKLIVCFLVLNIFSLAFAQEAEDQTLLPFEERTVPAPKAKAKEETFEVPDVPAIEKVESPVVAPTPAPEPVVAKPIVAPKPVAAPAPAPQPQVVEEEVIVEEVVAPAPVKKVVKAAPAKPTPGEMIRRLESGEPDREFTSLNGYDEKIGRLGKCWALSGSFNTNILTNAHKEWASVQVKIPCNGGAGDIVIISPKDIFRLNFKYDDIKYDGADGIAIFNSSFKLKGEISILEGEERPSLHSFVFVKAGKERTAAHDLGPMNRLRRK